MLAFGTAVALPSWAHDDGQETVVVTARKIEEAARDVPMQATVFSRERIRASRIESIRAIAENSPSLFYLDVLSAVDNALSLRGVSGNGVNEPAIGLFVDGIYQGGDPGYLSQELLDLERIEVLHGAQGAMYGKSTTAGAINLITRAPESGRRGTAAVAFSEPGREKIRVSASGRLRDETVLGRAAASYQRFDGIDRNDFSAERIGALREGVARAQLWWTPLDNVKLMPTVSLREVTQRPYAFRTVRGPGDFVGRPAMANEPGKLDYSTKHAAVRAVVEFGETELNALTGLNHANQSYSSDLDNSPIPSLAIVRNSERTDLSQELVFSRRGTRVNWLLGAYLFGLWTRSEQIIQTGRVGGPALSSVDADRLATTFSAFGRLAYTPVRWLEMEVQLRGDRDERTQEGRGAGADEIAFTEPSIRLTASVRPNAATMIYASFSGAHRPGGFNDGALPAFSSEQTVSYEFGMKTESKSGASFSAAVFSTRIRDQQVTELDPRLAAQLVVNRGRGGVEGIEAQGYVALSDALALSASASWMDARFMQFVTSQVGPTGFGVFDLSGNRLPYVPEYAGIVAAEHRSSWETSTLGALEGLARLQCRLNGTLAWDQFNTATAKPTQIVSASYALSAANWRLTLFGDNLLGESYLSAFLPGYQLPFTSGEDLGVVALPRALGIEFSVTF